MVLDLMENLGGDAELDVLSDPVVKEITTLLALRPLVGIHMKVEEDVVVEGGGGSLVFKIKESEMAKVPHPCSEQVTLFTSTGAAKFWSKVQGSPHRRGICVVVPAPENDALSVCVLLGDLLDQLSSDALALGVRRHAEMDDLDFLPWEVVEQVAEGLVAFNSSQQRSLAGAIKEALIRKEAERSFRWTIPEADDLVNKISSGLDFNDFDFHVDLRPLAKPFSPPVRSKKCAKTLLKEGLGAWQSELACRRFGRCGSSAAEGT
jgi:hypothetical protein